MEDKLSVVDTKNLSAQEIASLDSQVDEFIKRQTENKQDMAETVFDAMLALTATEKHAKEMVAQGFFKRLGKNITGGNTQTQNEINANILKAQYAAQETLQKLAEQSELTFELIAAVDNKLNTSFAKTNAKINNVYSMTLKLFSAMKAKVQSQEEQIKELNWIVDLKNQKYQGISYKKLDDVRKLVCLVRDFFEVSRRPYNFNRLETALDNLGLSNDRNRIIVEDFIREVAADNNLYEHLFAGTSQFATENEVLAFALKSLSEGKIFEFADKERVISCYDLALELLYNLDKLKYAEKLHNKLQKAKKLFLNYKIKDALSLLEELENAGKVEARYMLGIIYRSGFAVEKNFDKAKELIGENISAGDVSSIYFAWQKDIPISKKLPIDNFAELKRLADDGDVFAQYETARYYFAMGNIEEELKYLVRSAEQNYFLAINELALKYYRNENYDKAKEYFERGAAMNFGLSEFALGLIYWNGNGISADKTEAIKLYERAFEHGVSSEQLLFSLGDYFKNKGEYAAALKWWLCGAEKNYSSCIVGVGWIYQHGHGTNKNFAKAVEYYKKIVDEEGYKYLNEVLGDIYYCGDFSLKKDYSQSVFYYERAAKFSPNINAEEKLGNIYFAGGNGFTQNYEKAAKWYGMAYDHGSTSDDLKKNLIVAETIIALSFKLKKNYEDAAVWYKKVYGHGVDCIFDIGFCYYWIKNYDEAIKWFRLGEEKNNKDCALHVGFCYEYGNGVSKKDYSVAIYHYKKAIEWGYEGGLPERCIARIYLKGGYGVTADRDKAEKWFRESAARGDAEAMKWLLTNVNLSWTEKIIFKAKIALD